MSKLYIKKKYKIATIYSYVRPVLSYACATWAITKVDKKKLLRFMKKIL